ncbi:glycerol dehydratase reactivase beta/small subunit family protein [Sodalis ligni]|uniref:glycerol dehydratase reactivase beta/small subunit family protein n=1 Tax=Sodalis ligni TaxID=2697027 RepID=UPI00193FE8FF|nr:glycerol dehydratase reactivase beta/small subunit family protein [Sodalis ligni]QWA13733.1 glycerol dehydratase reactivase beta/small subunit family protein [Sodalis ligni]
MSLTEMTRPAILLLADTAAKRPGWRQLLLGMEEEGIPFVINDMDQQAMPLADRAHLAASVSPLSVGIAVGTEDIAVHDPHLPAHQPLFVLTRYPSRPAEEIRRLGCNAARLVKGLPFK